LADQATKIAAAHFLAPAGSIPVASFFSLTYVENTGVSFGMLEGLGNWPLLGLNAALTTGLLVFYLKRRREWPLVPRAALIAVLAGALGNLLDRICRGCVIDFLDFHFWPVFNVADSCISAGALAYAGWSLVHAKR